MIEDKLQLHLGCGNIRLPGFINIDCRYQHAVDKVDNIRYLRSYSNESIDFIYCAGVLEHFNRHEYIHVLERWFELLKNGGKLRLSVPDFDAIIKRYQKTKDLNDLMGMLYGGQDYADNFHHYIWTFNTLKNDLIKVGFKTVYQYNPLETEYAHIHDGSQCFLPRMDKINGDLVSLNVEAIK